MSASLGELAELLEELPNLLSAERARRQLSQEDAAGQIGVSVETLSSIERGQDARMHTVRQVIAWLLLDHSRTLREVG